MAKNLAKELLETRIVGLLRVSEGRGITAWEAAGRLAEQYPFDYTTDFVGARIHAERGLAAVKESLSDLLRDGTVDSKIKDGEAIYTLKARLSVR